MSLTNKETLISKLLTANHQYAKGFPIMTDSEYDIIWNQLRDIDPLSGVLYHTGDNKDLPFGRKLHRKQIFGTQKAFDITDLKPFFNRFGNDQLVIEPKLDGCAAIFYSGKDEHHDKLYLEGDGQSGSDISHHLPKIFCGFEPQNMESVELVIPNDLWKKKFGSNQRNTVSGWIAREELPHNQTIEMLSHHNGIMQELYKYDGNQDSLYELLLALYNQWSKHYLLDGIMIKVYDEKKRIIVGNNGTFYHWSIAWKPPIETAKTICKSIEWNVSRHGRIVPTVIYEPIELCGTTNKRVTGNNAQWILDKEIQIKSHLVIGKAGSIIPKILSAKNQKTLSDTQGVPKKDVLPKTGTTPNVTENHVKTTPYGVPTNCPICNHLLKWQGKDLICDSSDCLVQTMKSIAYFYSDKGMDVKTIGEQRIWELLQYESMMTLLKIDPWLLLDPNLFGIKNYLISIWGEKITDNYLDSLKEINNKKTIINFISGLGYNGLAFKTTKKIYYYVKYGQRIKSVSAKAIDSYIEATQVFDQASKLLKDFSFAETRPPAEILYCITGTLTQTREDMIKYLETKKWDFNNSLTMSCNYLIIGENPGRIKQENAKKYGIKVINENQMMELIK